MPTIPITQVLDRERTYREGQAVVNIIVPLLTETVDFSTVIFNDIIKIIKVVDVTDFPFLVLFLHNLEMADGVADLARHANPTPITPLVRSMFEGLLSLEYLAQGDDKRPLYWMYYYFRKLRESNQRFLDNSGNGERIREISTSDTFVSAFDFSKYSVSAAKNIDELNIKLDNPIFSDVIKAFPSKNLTRDWYSYNNGPRNLRDLSRELGKEIIYDLFYSPWSEVSHAKDGLRFIEGIKRTKKGKSVLRSLEQFPTLTNMSMSLLLSTLNILCERYDLKGKIQEWYIHVVRDQYMQFVNQYIRVKDNVGK